MNGDKQLTVAEARSLVFSILRGQGQNETVANSVANALVAAETEGQPGHGLSRIPAYLGQLQAGKINPEARVSVNRMRSSALLIDADGGFSFPALDVAFEEACKVVAETGVVGVSVSRSHHCGSLGYQVERFARRGVMAIMVANAPKAMAAWGGKKPVFGTNPIAFAAPVPNSDPIVIDLSLSRVARGKVMLAAREGREIPDNWAQDVDGNPTTDPNAALAGTMLPIGDAKGTALALMVEVLAAAFTGSNLSSQASSFFDSDGPRPHTGQFLIIMDPASGSSTYGEAVRRLVETMLSEDGVRLPGARRVASIRNAHTRGINVKKKLFAELIAYPGAEIVKDL